MLESTIFAYGSGRSGTTLLAKLIDASRSVLYRHEPDKTFATNTIPFLPEPSQYDEFRDRARAYLEQLTIQRDPQVSGKRPIFEKDFRTPLGTHVLKILYPIAAMARKAHVRVPVPDLVISHDYRYLIKSVSSICRVPMFARAVPGMKFLHIVRHPGAVVASRMEGIEKHLMKREVYIDSLARMSNARKFSISYEDICEASFEEQTAYTWMIENDKSESELHSHSNYLLISYEDLCLNMRERVSDIFQFIGIKLDDQIDDFITSMHGVASESDYFSVFRNPLGNIDKWEASLDATATDRINAIIQQSNVGRFVISNYEIARKKLHS